WWCCLWWCLGLVVLWWGCVWLCLWWCGCCGCWLGWVLWWWWCCGCGGWFVCVWVCGSAVCCGGRGSLCGGVCVVVGVCLVWFGGAGDLV
ncbi:hypothetical protein, partial [Pseudomonas syringae group genomosp. 7]|uniref:hypothetical protein n=1 Tax=Pseudomonas syringae group genomosp. 7 TaxID=251699 RepID=UPI00376FC7D2